MLTAWFTFLSILVLIVILISKAVFLTKQGLRNKNFLWSSIEMGLAVFALMFLVAIMVTQAYGATIDEYFLTGAIESSFYLYVGGVLFAIDSFFYVLEAIVILVNDIFKARKGFMPAFGKRGRMQSAKS